MKKLCLILSLTAVCAFSGTADSGSTVPTRKFIVGVGGGSEAGNGVHLGISKGMNTIQMGLGFLYGEDADSYYSFGLRYFRTLVCGRLNDTYIWTGGGLSGTHEEGANRFWTSFGLGPGLSYHFEVPFHFNLDCGFRIRYYSGVSTEEISFEPTINGSVTYHW